MLICSSVAVAFGPSDALQRADGPRVLEAHERVQLAAEALAATVRGVSAKFAAVPSVSYGADVEDPATFEASLALDLDVEYRYDTVAILSARIDLEKAQLALQDARRWEGKEALELYGALLRAHLAVSASQRDLTEARDELSAARADGDPYQVRYAELELREAELAVEDEAAQLAGLERRAFAMGLTGIPTFDSTLASTLFAVRHQDARETPTYRILELTRRHAAERLDRQRAFGTLQSIEVATRYESKSDRYQLDGSFGLSGGIPYVGAGMEYRPQQDDQWTVGLTARIGLDQSTSGTLARREHDLAEAEREMAAYEEAFFLAAAEELRLAENARARLEIALETWQTRSAEAEALRAAGADASRLDERAARDLDRVYLAWLRYVEEVDDYLELVGADWVIAVNVD